MLVTLRGFKASKDNLFLRESIKKNGIFEQVEGGTLKHSS